MMKFFFLPLLLLSLGTENGSNIFVAETLPNTQLMKLTLDTLRFYLSEHLWATGDGDIDSAVTVSTADLGDSNTVHNVTT